MKKINPYNTNPQQALNMLGSLRAPRAWTSPNYAGYRSGYPTTFSPEFMERLVSSGKLQYAPPQQTPHVPAYAATPYGEPVYRKTKPPTFAEVMSHSPDLPYQYPSPVQPLQRPGLGFNALRGTPMHEGPFGLNATVPHIPNPEGILTGIEGGPVQVYSPFPPPGGPTTYPDLFTAVNPVTGEIQYFYSKRGGRKTRARRKKRSKTRRH